VANFSVSITGELLIADTERNGGAARLALFETWAFRLPTLKRFTLSCNRGQSENPTLMAMEWGPFSKSARRGAPPVFAELTFPKMKRVILRQRSVRCGPPAERAAGTLCPAVELPHSSQKMA
jgi:hypothetical protein